MTSLLTRLLRTTCGVCLIFCTSLTAFAQTETDECTAHSSRIWADQGNAFAQMEIGICYSNAGDDEQAVSWYQKAAEQGQAIAQTLLGASYSAGRGMPQDDEQAVSWYQKAAQQGEAIAQLNLGMMYRAGRLVPQDDGQAASWYQKAAEQGEANAQQNLGAMYYSGQGVPQSYQECYFWFILAVAQGAEESIADRDLCKSNLTPSVIEDVRRKAAIYFEKF
jgi:TPR repeat protein